VLPRLAIDQHRVDIYPVRAPQLELVARWLCRVVALHCDPHSHGGQLGRIVWCGLIHAALGAAALHRFLARG
jgi:hypothetical protein